MNRQVLVLKEGETEQLQTGDTIALDRIPHPRHEIDKGFDQVDKVAKEVRDVIKDSFIIRAYGLFGIFCRADITEGPFDGAVC